MNKNNTTVENLQEIVDKVFPPYTGDLKDALVSVVTTVEDENYLRAVDLCINFQPCNPNTNLEQWMELDWALSVPGVAESFPELVSALEAHFSITLSYRDLSFMLEAAMESGRTLDPLRIDEGIETYWNQFGHTLPADFRDFIEQMFHDVAGNKIGDEYPDDLVFGKEFKL